MAKRGKIAPKASGPKPMAPHLGPGLDDYVLVEKEIHGQLVPVKVYSTPTSIEYPQAAKLIPIKQAKVGDEAIFRRGPRKVVERHDRGLSFMSEGPGMIGSRERPRKVTDSRVIVYNWSDLKRMGVTHARPAG